MNDTSPVPKWVIGLIILCCTVEAALILGPVLGYGPVRQGAYLFGAFWSSAFTYGGVYPEQAYLMFLSYGLLHGGLIHLAMNMISLAVVSRELARFVGAWAMILIYLLSQIGAAALFLVMEPSGGPMIGASGAIFGLAGALIAHACKWRRDEGRSMRPILRAVLIIGGLNVAITVLVQSIAWQAHLGGLFTGAALGFVLPVSKRRNGAHEHLC